MLPRQLQLKMDYQLTKLLNKIHSNEQVFWTQASIHEKHAKLSQNALRLELVQVQKYKTRKNTNKKNVVPNQNKERSCHGPKIKTIHIMQVQLVMGATILIILNDN